ncbi:radical SAM protein [bacterium]|nr:radical SAM protein [candidate division CSSED10-310 bacterium]
MINQKVLLLKPCWNYPIDPGDSTYNRNWPPLSLLNIAAMLQREGIHADVVDAGVERLSADRVAKIAEGYTRVFITSASLDRWQCPNLNIDPFVKTVFHLKKVCSSIYLMGTHGSVRPREILDKTGVMAVIRNEPEETVVEICRGVPLESISGLTFLRGDDVVITPDRPLMDLTQLPIPAYDRIDLSRYHYEVLGDRFALLEASRGCPFDCIFCVKSMYGKGFRIKNTDQFIREVDAIIDHAGARTAYFIDLEFTVNRPLAEAVSRHLIARGTPLNWCVQTRADSVDLPLMKLMRQAGCRIVHFGVESGSERIRRTLNKGITFEQVEKGLRAAREAGMQTVCFFMFGLPGETVEDMEQTIRFARKLNPTFASFHIALPYPGTEFYRQVADEIGGELFPHAYTGIVPYGHLERITMKAFRSFYLRPRYIAGRLKDREFSTFFHQARFFISYLKHRLWN